MFEVTDEIYEAVEKHYAKRLLELIESFNGKQRFGVEVVSLQRYWGAIAKSLDGLKIDVRDSFTLDVALAIPTGGTKDYNLHETIRDVALELCCDWTMEALDSLGTMIRGKQAGELDRMDFFDAIGEVLLDNELLEHHRFFNEPIHDFEPETDSYFVETDGSITIAELRLIAASS